MRFRSIVIAVSFALAPMLADALTVDELLAKNLEARGGADKVAAIKTLQVRRQARVRRPVRADADELSEGA